jgi:alpha-N-arabinofuranosidase
LYVPFQDATFVPIELEDVPEYRVGDVAVPSVSATAARAANGDLLVGLVNLHANEAVEVTLSFEGFVAASASGTVLAGDAIDAHNTFENPDLVKPAALDVVLGRESVTATLPARSVSVIAAQE